MNVVFSHSVFLERAFKERLCIKNPEGTTDLLDSSHTYWEDGKWFHTSRIKNPCPELKDYLDRLMLLNI